MKINYSLTEEDYLNFNMFHVKNSKTANKALNIQRFIAPLLFLAISYVLSIISDASFAGLFITFFITSILWVIFYPRYFYNLISRNTKKMIQEGKNDSLLGMHHLIMTEEGIIESTSSGETRASWSSIRELKEDENNFYLYNSAMSSIILPKRDLTNEEKVRTYITSKLFK